MVWLPPLCIPVSTLQNLARCSPVPRPIDPQQPFAGTLRFPIWQEVVAGTDQDGREVALHLSDLPECEQHAALLCRANREWPVNAVMGLQPPDGSLLTLRIVGVWVERLSEMTDDDAILSGAHAPDPLEDFIARWDETFGKESGRASVLDPWCAVLLVERL